MPANRDQQQHLAYAQCGQCKVVRLQPQHGRSNHRSQHDGQQDGQKQCVFSPPAVAHTENARNIRAHTKKAALRQRQRTRMAKDELKTQSQQCVNANDGEQAHLVGRRNTHRPHHQPDNSQ